jgi:hypothetical protein
MINYIKALPTDSTYARERYGEVAMWDLHLHRLTDILEVLLLANWQRSGSRSGFPTKIDRPGLDEPDVRSRQPIIKRPGDVLPDGETVLGADDLSALFDRRERAEG